MKLILPFLLLATLAFGQDDLSQDERKVSGVVARGVTYTFQYMDVNNDLPLTDLDTLQADFQVLISEGQKFVEISGIEDIDSVFEFKEMVTENLLENEHLGEMLEFLHYTQRNEYDFEVDYIDEIMRGGKHPIIVKLMYDDLWNSVKLYASFTQNGKNFFYNFYFDEVNYIAWDHGLTYSKEYTIDSYGETNTSGDEEVDVFEATDEANLVVNDTAFVVTSEKINLEKRITRSFNSTEKNIYMVLGAMFSIPYSGKWIFYSFDYNREKGAFDGYYYFGIKED